MPLAGARPPQLEAEERTRREQPARKKTIKGTRCANFANAGFGPQRHQPIKDYDRRGRSTASVRNHCANPAGPRRKLPLAILRKGARQFASSACVTLQRPRLKLEQVVTDDQIAGKVWAHRIQPDFVFQEWGTAWNQMREH